MNKVIIHGENILKPVSKLPEGTRTTHKEFIVGHSESGHHHILEAEQDFEVVEDVLHNIFVQLYAPAKVTHQKTFEIHETLPVKIGIYQVMPAEEYDPWQKAMRKQWD